MKALIGIMSCARDRDTHRASRDTWLLNSPLDHVFFMGRGAKASQPDELVVDAEDDYEHVTEKSKEMFRYALNKGYSHIFHCGRDTYINAWRLGHSKWLEDIHYAGHRTSGGIKAHYAPLCPDKRGWYEYTSGGAGTWLSAWAMEKILESPLYHVADDLLYGWILGQLGVAVYHDPRFLKWGKYLKTGDISVHLGRKTGVYDPEWMYRAHRRST